MRAALPVVCFAIGAAFALIVTHLTYLPLF